MRVGDALKRCQQPTFVDALQLASYLAIAREFPDEDGRFSSADRTLERAARRGRRRQVQRHAQGFFGLLRGSTSSRWPSSDANARIVHDDTDRMHGLGLSFPPRPFSRVGDEMFANTNPRLWPVIGGAAVIIGSPLLMLATGVSETYNLWLAVMMAAVWFAQRLSKREVGVAIGDGTSYLAALVYVVVIIGIVAAGAWAANLIDVKDLSATTVVRRVTLNFLVTFIFTLVSEDGFLRGALWGSCQRAGFSPAKTVIWTSIAFGLWHLMVPIIDTDFTQPLAKVPQYVVGSTAFGVSMALLRLRSGSVSVPSACHALWNATVYTFFGAGEKLGQLGVTDATIWDPERGYAGLVMAVAAAIVLWMWIKPSHLVR